VPQSSALRSLKDRAIYFMICGCTLPLIGLYAGIMWDRWEHAPPRPGWAHAAAAFGGPGLALLAIGLLVAVATWIRLGQIGWTRWLLGPVFLLSFGWAVALMSAAFAGDRSWLPACLLPHVPLLLKGESGKRDRRIC
jgi:hypothetical protein